MSDDQDWYTILGVQRTCTDEEVKKAYRRLALVHHPDRGGDEKKFQEIQSAYDCLSDTMKRTWYNRHGRKPMPPSKPVTILVALTLEELYSGTTKRIDQTVIIPCILCRCHSCEGMGRVQQRTVHMIRQIQCPTCNGRGHCAISESSCVVCAGTCEKKYHIQREISIPKGFDIQHRPLDSWDQDGVTYHAAIQLQPHALYELQYPHLLMRIQIPLVDALTGYEKRIQHFNHINLHLKYDDMIQLGDSFVVKNCGMPCEQGYGHLVVIVDKIIWPETLDENQKTNIRLALLKSRVSSDTDQTNHPDNQTEAFTFSCNMIKQQQQHDMQSVIRDNPAKCRPI
jgi:DnaJ family protein A protein 2